MTITTLIGLTEEEYDRAKTDYEHEYFQLEEIARHYDARMRRRDVKRNIMRKLAFATSIDDYDKYKARWAKLEELNRHHERDSVRWYACMNRKSSLIDRWLEMRNELETLKKASA